MYYVHSCYVLYVACLIIATLKGNCHELRMHLSKFVCDNMPGFLAAFRSRRLLFCLELSLSLPKPRHMAMAGGFALHRCRRESNLKSSDCLFQVNCSWQSPFKVASRAYSKIRRWHLRHMFTRNSIKTSLIRNMSNSKASGENQTYKLTQM